MGNFIRFVLLLFVILAGVTLVVHRHFPQVLVKVDTQLRYWHKKPYLNEHKAIKGLPMPGGREEAVSRLEESLHEMSDTRLGDNRFPIWRSMVHLLSDHYRELGSNKKMAELLRKALKTDPHNLEMRSDLVQALGAIGTLESVESANEHLSFIRHRFPSSSTVANLDLMLAMQARDGKAMALALTESNINVREELLINWQAFLFPSEGAYTKSDMAIASPDPEGALVRVVIEIEAPASGVVRIRLDPPSGQSGIIRDWGFVLRDEAGQELVRETKVWQSALRTVVHPDGSLQLDGKVDPQWILKLKEPLKTTSQMTVEFWFRPDNEMPVEVEKALEDPQVREAFDAEMVKIHAQGGQDS